MNSLKVRINLTSDFSEVFSKVWCKVYEYKANKESN
jgi:hypothetical protein